MLRRFVPLAFTFILFAMPVAAQQKIGRIVSDDAPQTDTTTLKAAGLKPDDPQGLVNYFKQRTLSDSELTRIKAVISRMGSEVFEDREKASAEVLTFGPAAIGPLRTAASAEVDFEISYRAEDARKKIEKVPHSNVAVAAARALVKSKHADGVSAMLGFLPLADNESVVIEIGKALTTLADENGKPASALVAALTDKEAVRRGAAIVALLDGGNATKAVRFPEVFANVKTAVMTDADAEVKFRGIYLLLTRAKDQDAVQGLIDTMPNLPRGRLWQAEDILTQMAYEGAPKARFGKTPESREKAKTEWSKWWQDVRKDLDFATFVYKPTTTGTLLCVELDNRGWGNGKVLMLSPALKEQWAIKGLNYPSDAAMLNDGRVLIAEQNNNRMQIRTPGNTSPTPDKLINCNMPMSIDVGKDGRVLVVGRNEVYDFDDKWKEEVKYSRGNHDMVAGRRLANGEVLIFTNNQPNCIKLDKTWKEVGKPFKLGTPYYMAQISVVSDTEILITESNQVAQYNIKDTKDDKALATPTWKKSIANPTCAQRLSNGNTLIVSAQTNRVVEVAPDGEELWEWSPTDGLRLQRAYRR